MSDSLLIYGATGFTGRLVAQAMRTRGLSPVLCARGEDRLRTLATELSLSYLVADIEDRAVLDSAVKGIGVVLNMAGPFSATARPLLEACLRAGAHYLDLSAESATIEEAHGYDAAARDRKVMVMPGVGFDVVPSDSLAAHVARRLPGARRLSIGISGLELMSRGSARTIVEEFGNQVQIRRLGNLVAPVGALERDFDYGNGPRRSVAVTWGDAASAFYTTGIPNIEVYFEATLPVRMAAAARQAWGPLMAVPGMKSLWQAQLGFLPEGPSESDRSKRTVCIVAEAEDASGRKVSSRMWTPEAYTMTALTAPGIVARVLEGDWEPGFQTPARVYGPDAVLSFPGVRREDIS